MPLSGAYRSLDHIALPYDVNEGFQSAREFWESLGFRILEYRFENDVDHAGAGTRYKVGPLTRPFLAYFPSDLSGGDIKRVTQFGHVGITVAPNVVQTLRDHLCFDHETHWGPGHISIFIKGPYGLRIEFIARDVGDWQGSSPHRVDKLKE